MHYTLMHYTRMRLDISTALTLRSGYRQ